MTQLKEKAADTLQGIDGTDPETQLLSKERIMKTVSSLPANAKDWNGHTVSDENRRTFRADHLEMQNLCSGDQHTVGGSLDRASYFVTVKA